MALWHFSVISPLAQGLRIFCLTVTFFLFPGSVSWLAQSQMKAGWLRKLREDHEGALTGVSFSESFFPCKYSVENANTALAEVSAVRAVRAVFCFSYYSC